MKRAKHFNASLLQQIVVFSTDGLNSSDLVTSGSFLGWKQSKNSHVAKSWLSG